MEGVIGSADVWNSELDRIRYFHDRYQTSVEEMETASAAQIAAEFKVPFVGIRVLSNNITNQGNYDPQNRAGMPGLCLSGGEGLCCQPEETLSHCSG